MGYIIKENQGLLITRLTDTGRKKISEGNFNVSYFQIGDSEVNYNAIANYDITNFQNASQLHSPLGQLLDYLSDF